jgi:hypothetical protein
MRQNSGLLAGVLAPRCWSSLGQPVQDLEIAPGGGAWHAGATLVEPDLLDPLRRRLRNVVEELPGFRGAGAGVRAGREPGINAFAADTLPPMLQLPSRGIWKSSAARSCGVIAHEFSHILNGDMRINIRLMGALFGICSWPYRPARDSAYTPFGRSRGRALQRSC